jgi:hypothetical protein
MTITRDLELEPTGELQMNTLGGAFLASISAAMISLASHAAGASGVKVGLLRCSIDGGWGLVITSSKSVDCVFEPTDHGWRDHYVGSIDKLGVDIGLTNGSRLIWAVFAPGRVHRGSLAGLYVGASVEATLGVGVGTNVLIGGFQHSINLQPVSLQGQLGMNVAGGIAGLSLESH